MRTDVVRLGRLSGERTGEMMHFLSSMRADRCIADADILVDIAHVLMLDKQKIIDHDIAQSSCPHCWNLYDEGIPEEAFDDRFEDVHAGIESLLIESAGCGCRRTDAHGTVTQRRGCNLYPDQTPRRPAQADGRTP